MQQGINASLGEAVRAFTACLEAGGAAQVAKLAQCVLDCLRDGGTVYTCGNGGSMAEAMHFAEECTGRFHRDRVPLPVLAFSDPTHLTCVANDYGFEAVFERMVQALGRKGDVLLVFSTSGRSPNVVRACQAARAKGMPVLGMLGGDGGEVADLCDAVFMPPTAGSARTQELHQWAVHAILESVEAEMFSSAS